MIKRNKTDEADFRSKLREQLLPRFDCVSMETRLGDGLPDEFIVCKETGQASWVELKQLNPDAPFNSFRLASLQPEQAIFACKRVQAQRHVNSMILIRFGVTEFAALPAMPDVDWTMWSRRTISLIGMPRFPIIRMSSYDQIADLLRQNLYQQYVETQVPKIPLRTL